MSTSRTRLWLPPTTLLGFSTQSVVITALGFSTQSVVITALGFNFSTKYHENEERLAIVINLLYRGLQVGSPSKQTVALKCLIRLSYLANSLYSNYSQLPFAYCLQTSVLDWLNVKYKCSS